MVYDENYLDSAPEGTEFSCSFYKALRILKKKIQKEGLQLEIKNRRYYETGTAKKKREKNEAIKREKRRLAKERGIC